MKDIYSDTFTAPFQHHQIDSHLSTHTNLSNLTVKTSIFYPNQEIKSQSSPISPFFQFNALTTDSVILHQFFLVDSQAHQTPADKDLITQKL